MKEFLFDFFGNTIFFYSLTLIASYVYMMILAGKKIIRQKEYSLEVYDKELIRKSPYAPGVSIVAPAYNEEKSIERVVNHVINDYPEYDYVVVNDGSKDHTAKICRKNGYNLIDLPVNLGLAGAFQTGLKYAYRQGYE